MNLAVLLALTSTLDLAIAVNEQQCTLSNLMACSQVQRDLLKELAKLPQGAISKRLHDERQKLGKMTSEQTRDLGKIAEEMSTAPRPGRILNENDKGLARTRLLAEKKARDATFQEQMRAFESETRDAMRMHPQIAWPGTGASKAQAKQEKLNDIQKRKRELMDSQGKEQKEFSKRMADINAGKTGTLHNRLQELAKKKHERMNDPALARQRKVIELATAIQQHPAPKRPDLVRQIDRLPPVEKSEL